MHAAVAEMEQEKFDLQKKHTDNIQELLEDTNQRLAKMEAEYSSQTQATVSAFTHTSTLLNGNIQCLALLCSFYIHSLNFTCCCVLKPIRMKFKCYTYALVTFWVKKQGCISVVSLSSMTFCFKSSAVMAEQQAQFQNQITCNYKKTVTSVHRDLAEFCCTLMKTSVIINEADYTVHWLSYLLRIYSFVLYNERIHYQLEHSTKQKLKHFEW